MTAPVDLSAHRLRREKERAAARAAELARLLPEVSIELRGASIEIRVGPKEDPPPAPTSAKVPR